MDGKSSFDAVPGDLVALGSEESRVVNGVLAVRSVEIRQVVYTREHIASTRAALDEAEKLLDDAEDAAAVARLASRGIKP
jgi:hypothetical protein